MRHLRVCLTTALALAVLTLGAVAVSTAADDDKREPDVIFVPTPQEVVDKMLELAKVGKDDVVYDLGCGDGRIVLTAARKFGCKAKGFDIDPERIKECKANYAKEDKKVQDLVTFDRKDIFTLDLSGASVVTLYLLPELNVKLVPQLKKLKPGSRIVSHDFDMRGYKPDQKVTVKTKDDREKTVYLWTIPLKEDKSSD
jgi:SAM-dependent methyltransferase